MRRLRVARARNLVGGFHDSFRDPTVATRCQTTRLSPKLNWQELKARPLSLVSQSFTSAPHWLLSPAKLIAGGRA